jgi:outer membrane lipoprotein-sorting protein
MIWHSNTRFPAWTSRRPRAASSTRAWRPLVPLAVVLGLTALAADRGVAADAEFSAELSMIVSSNMTATGKVFVKGPKRRNEMVMFDHPATSIVRHDKQVVWILLPNNQYRQVPLHFDPLHPTSETPYDTQELGTEKVNGYECKKLLLTFKEPAKGSVLQWFAPALNAPIRFEVKNKDGKVVNTTEYKNIKPGPQPDSLFEIPAGYTLQSSAPRPARPPAGK